MSKYRAGFLVETKDNKVGRTYHDEELVNGKIRVHLEDETKVLCSQGTLKVKGYIN